MCGLDNAPVNNDGWRHSKMRFGDERNDEKSSKRDKVVQKSVVIVYRNMTTRRRWAARFAT